MDVTYIYYKNKTNSISMNDDFNVLHKYYAYLLSLNNQEGVSTGI